MTGQIGMVKPPLLCVAFAPMRRNVGSALEHMISQLLPTASSSIRSPSRFSSAFSRVSPVTGTARPKENVRLTIAVPPGVYGWYPSCPCPSRSSESSHEPRSKWSPGGGYAGV